MADRRRPPSAFRPKSRTEGAHATPTGTSRHDGGRLRGDGGGSSDEDSLGRQNVDLRQRLHEEASHYKKRLDTYRQAQQSQASLISRLQAKVLQYKQRCSELEDQMAQNVVPTQEYYPSLPHTTTAPSTALEQAQLHLREVREERIGDLDTALRRLDEERRKCGQLLKLNTTLREQLEESHSTNEALTVDLQKLTNDWEALREEMIIKEDEWKDEEQAFNDYYSTEHNRLLNLWRDVVSVKRMFMDVQSATERDLGKLKTEVQDAGKEMIMACTRMDNKMFSESLFGGKDKYAQEHENSELKGQIDALKNQHEKHQSELNSKEEKIQQLLKEVQVMEERCIEAEQHVSQIVKMQEENEILQSALRDIAHALIQDAEHNPELLTHIHLTGTTSIPQKSPKRHIRSMASAAAFSESTISAVQAALHKYQSFIHELQVKLQSNKEQLLLVRKQNESSEINVAALEKRTKELVAQLDACRTQCSTLAQEKDILQKTCEQLKNDKNQLDRNRVELNALIDNLTSDYQKLQHAAQLLQKDNDTLQDEKIFLHSEVDRLNQDADSREISLRGEEDRCSRIREELLTTREELNKLYLAHDMLEQEKLEADKLISSLEKSKADFEVELDKLLGDRSSTHDSLVKKENILANIEADKKKLQEDIKKLNEERSALQTQCNDHLSDIQSLRKELLQAEQQRLDLESDKVSLGEKCKFLDIEKGKIEMELTQVTRERNDLSNQLTVMARKKEGLNEELIRLRQRLEQANETNARVNRSLEDLVKDCEEKQCIMDGMDKEIQRMQEQIAAIHSEKEALEGVLFDTQTNLEASDSRKLQLEKEQQELLVKQEQLKSQIGKLTKDLERSEKRNIETKNSLTQSAGNKEMEFRQIIDKLKQASEENTKKLTDEREKIRSTLEKRLAQSLLQQGNEKDAEIRQLVDRIEGLQGHIDNLCQQHEELMLRAENDKQQALLIAHHDHQALHDRLETIKRELESEKETLERHRREANSRFDQDRTIINQLKEELNKTKTKFDDAKQKCEEEKTNLAHRIEETKNERDTALAEVENTRVQLHLTENKYETLNNQLHETLRKLKEVENNSDCLRKDLTNVQRQLTDCNFEKEKYHNTNKELREHVKRTEGEKRDQARQLEETFQKITNLEEIKQSIENEKTRIQNQAREIEKQLLQAEHRIASQAEEIQKAQSAGTQQQAEEKELQARLLNEVEERERSHQEIHQLRKQMSELERNLEQTRQELGRTRAHTGHLEEQWHAREQDLLVHLEDSRSREKRLEDQKHNLEVCLVDATQQIQELKAKLGGAEGRIRALEAQLGQLESSKRDVEQKLTSVVSTLRRIAGIQLDGTVSMPYRLLSPSRRWSPARTHDERDGSIDIDPEVVRKGVRNLMQQVAHIERERDDYKTQVSTIKKQLQECTDHQSKGDSKLNKALHNLRILQEEKGSLENKLGQKTVELKSQTDALNKKVSESQEMREKIVSLELSLSSGNEEKMQYEDKLEKMRIALSRLEAEKRALQEELGRMENRSTKLELQRMSAEGDMNRLQMMLQEKDATIQKLQEKCDTQNRTVVSLEERCVSLKSTIDQMNVSLERAANSESELRSEIQTLQKSLLETSNLSNSGAEKLKQLQKALATSENERRILTERFDVTQQNLAELRRNNQILQDQVSRLNNELANNEVQRSGLESQLRLAQWPQDASISGHQEDELYRQLQTVQRERSELRGKVDVLNNKLRQLESEKRTMEYTIAKTPAAGRSKSFERQEKYELDSSISEQDKFEQENRELRHKVSRLEAELASKDAELSRLREQRPALDAKFDRAEIERYRAAQLQAERLLEAREQSHRQQVSRLENQVTSLRDQLNQEIKRRQQYVLRSTKAGREMQQLRQALGDSLRTVSQDPGIDALLLEHEARKLDNTMATTASLPSTLNLPSSYRRSMTPQPK